MIPATVPCENIPFCRLVKSTAAGLELGPAGSGKQTDECPVEKLTPGFENGMGTLDALGLKFSARTPTKLLAVVGFEDVTVKVG